MKLISFQTLNYRSINDSGDIAVGKITSLVGRNEAGKSNLLLALHTINPVGGPKDLSPIKNFPRQKRLSECTDETPVVSTTWELGTEEQAELTAIFPRAAGVTQVEIGRNYKAVRTVAFQNLKPIAFSASEIAARIRKIQPVAEVEIEKLDAAAQTPAKSELTQFAGGLATTGSPTQWATNAAPALTAFRKALAVAAVTLPDREEGLVSELEEIASQITKDGPAWQEARNWAVGKLPIFVYVDEYPELTGHQNIAEYLARKAANPSQLTDADRNFEKMCKVADLSPQQLHQLHGANEREISSPTVRAPSSRRSSGGSGRIVS